MKTSYIFTKTNSLASLFLILGLSIFVGYTQEPRIEGFENYTVFPSSYMGYLIYYVLATEKSQLSPGEITIKHLIGYEGGIFKFNYKQYCFNGIYIMNQVNDTVLSTINLDTCGGDFGLGMQYATHVYSYKVNLNEPGIYTVTGYLHNVDESALSVSFEIVQGTSIAYTDNQQSTDLIKKKSSSQIVFNMTDNWYLKNNSLEIFDWNGGVIKKFNNVTKEIYWDTKGIKKGVYFLKAAIGDKKIVHSFILD